METICYIVIEIGIALASAVIIAFIIYVFKKPIKRYFFGNDLLPASKIPNINVQLFDGGMWDEKGVPMSSLYLSNEGELGVSKIKVFCYKHIKNEDKMIIKLLSKNINYQRANSNCGEMVGVTLKNLHQFFNPFDTTEGLFIEMTDEHNIVFCQTVYIGKKEDDCLTATPQTIKRLKKSLPKRKIEKKSNYLESKYGVDISVG